MAKNCCKCGKSLGMLSSKADLKDGVICHKCQKEGGLESIGDMRHFTTEQVKKIIAERCDIVKNFHKTNSFDCISIDLDNHAFRIDGTIYFFNELLSYSYHEDPENKRLQTQDGTSSGAAIGGAIGGLGNGLIGGAIGAAVGGAIGSFFSTCNHMYINIIVQGPLKKGIKLDFITTKTRLSSDEYSNASRKAQECLEALRLITNQNMPEKPESSKAHHIDEKKTLFIQKEHLTAAEIEKELETYQRMLYSSLISQEEYDQKKKQLLSMM